MNVWQKFTIQNLGQHHDLYVKCDVLLLADFFQNFRALCGHYYKIDSTHTFTSPGLALQACLRMTNTELQMLTDINMFLYFAEAGRVSSVNDKRHAKTTIPMSLITGRKSS